MIAIIGGGAAGMMAAIQAARLGKKVTLIEHNSYLGKKMGITGKGRCNVTNDCDVEELFLNVPGNSKFLYSAFYSFSNYNVKEFFEDLGVPLKVERGQRVFPVSDKARDIVDAMRNEIKRLGVNVLFDHAKSVETKDGRVDSVVCKNTVIKCDSCLIATGGKSYPQTGSTGDGYIMAQKMGHTVTELRPSLIPIVASSVKSLMGLSLKNVSVTVLDEKGKKLYTDLGEMLFTHYGMSGPIILSASGHMRKDNEYTIVLDLKPALDRKTLDLRLLRDFEKNINKDFINSLDELLPQKIIPFVVGLSGIDQRRKVNTITKEERTRLIDAIKEIKIPVEGFRPISEAIVTAGGISVKEIDPSTMESKKVGGLYFAGEIIDVDAYTGGFNLQIAFSTGYVAGINM
ncbi:MAG: NAD(P)/FAD-dependent oxidoreductase [Clostridia bacterium]